MILDEDWADALLAYAEQQLFGAPEVETLKIVLTATTRLTVVEIAAASTLLLSIASTRRAIERLEAAGVLIPDRVGHWTAAPPERWVDYRPAPNTLTRSRKARALLADMERRRVNASGAINV
jgi:hypothetical protein